MKKRIVILNEDNHKIEELLKNLEELNKIFKTDISAHTGKINSIVLKAISL